jgi:NADH:ubiquinone oxidoreductase subunit F (NADH-binding)
MIFRSTLVLEKYSCFIGSAAVVILSDKDDVKAAVLNLMRFFEDESAVNARRAASERRRP